MTKIKRYYGEEATQLTKAEYAAHQARMADPSYDILSALVPAPTQPPLAPLVYDKPVTRWQREIAMMPKARGYDPRHIEGYMRLQHDIIGRLSKQQFSREVTLCIACIKEGGLDAAERNAQSFGL
jgi:hypothetical protein